MPHAGNQAAGEEVAKVACRGKRNGLVELCSKAEPQTIQRLFNKRLTADNQLPKANKTLQRGTEAVKPDVDVVAGI